MSVLMWLAPVPLATVAAILWRLWTGRSRRPASPEESMRAFRRFGAAIASPPGGHQDDPRQRAARR